MLICNRIFISDKQWHFIPETGKKIRCGTHTDTHFVILSATIISLNQHRTVITVNVAATEEKGAERVREERDERDSRCRSWSQTLSINNSHPQHTHKHSENRKCKWTNKITPICSSMLLFEITLQH